MEPTLGAVTDFIGPGQEGRHITQDWQDSAMDVCRTADPALTFVYVPYQSDQTIEPSQTSEMINGLVSIYDRTILVVDTHHSQRRKQRAMDPLKCQGDA